MNWFNENPKKTIAVALLFVVFWFMVELDGEQKADAGLDIHEQAACQIYAALDSKIQSNNPSDVVVKDYAKRVYDEAVQSHAYDLRGAARDFLVASTKADEGDLKASYARLGILCSKF